MTSHGISPDGNDDLLSGYRYSTLGDAPTCAALQRERPELPSRCHDVAAPDRVPPGLGVLPNRPGADTGPSIADTPRSITQERTMTKHQRGNKEAKKPKKQAVAVTPPAVAVVSPVPAPARRPGK